jgi:2,5-diamino-6-(ribosylamino)-4(3H)-pyrimidinone 5'-phosphate reductase
VKPKVILYTAVSLDGRTTGFPVDLGVFYSLAQEWGEDASLVGCDTLLAAPDEIPAEEETDAPPPAPGDDDTRPILVVPDSRGRLKTWHYWQRQPYWKDFVSLCTGGTPKEHMAYLDRRGVKTLCTGTERVDLGEALEGLNRAYGVEKVRVDSGGALSSVLLRAGLADEVHLLLHPVLAGGADAKSFFSGPGPEMEGGLSLSFVGAKTMEGGLVLLSYQVRR